METHAVELQKRPCRNLYRRQRTRRVGGSHTLERLTNEVAKDIEDPETNTVWKRMQSGDPPRQWLKKRSNRGL
jgi:hypothetical protein